MVEVLLVDEVDLEEVLQVEEEAEVLQVAVEALVVVVEDVVAGNFL